MERFDFTDEKMEANNKLSTQELQDLIREQFGSRSKLGSWVFKKTCYCQLISEQNCKKRFEFCLKMLMDNKNFEIVIFTDKTKIEMETNIQRKARKEGDQRYKRLKP